jgi:hypothetical protein
MKKALGTSKKALGTYTLGTSKSALGICKALDKGKSSHADKRWTAAMKLAFS